ncbi:MAG TPA: hypothetical protein VEI96_07660 [Thermodesulfovibrionales bacterium]|nr:hypothetical protein [Thermodesulfovibrionales bacterium]
MDESEPPERLLPERIVGKVREEDSPRIPDDDVGDLPGSFDEEAYLPA